MLNFVPPILTGKMRPNVCSLPCQMHGISLLRFGCMLGNLVVVYIAPLFTLWPLFGRWQLCWLPLVPSCLLRGRNTICFRRFVGCVWFPFHLVLEMHWEEGEPVLRIQFFWFRWVWTHLQSVWNDMAVFLHLFLNVPRHWYVYPSVDIVPVKGDSAVEVSGPIHGECIVSLQACN